MATSTVSAQPAETLDRYRQVRSAALREMARSNRQTSVMDQIDLCRDHLESLDQLLTRIGLARFDHVLEADRLERQRESVLAAEHDARNLLRGVTALRQLLERKARAERPRVVAAPTSPPAQGRGVGTRTKVPGEPTLLEQVLGWLYLGDQGHGDLMRLTGRSTGSVGGTTWTLCRQGWIVNVGEPRAVRWHLAR